MRFSKALKFVWYYLTEKENILLLLIREEATNYLKNFYNIGVESTEDIEDLIFHIDNYLDIPVVVKRTQFSNMRFIKYHFRKNGDVEITAKGPEPTKQELKIFMNYVCEVERQRAVERDFICESLKKLPFGFKF